MKFFVNTFFNGTMRKEIINEYSLLISIELQRFSEFNKNEKKEGLILFN